MPEKEKNNPDIYAHTVRPFIRTAAKAKAKAALQAAAAVDARIIARRTRGKCTRDRNAKQLPTQLAAELQ
jgi:hypothetical protein